jgi:hypothetical protein
MGFHQVSFPASGAGTRCGWAKAGARASIIISRLARRSVSPVLASALMAGAEYPLRGKIYIDTPPATTPALARNGHILHGLA